MGSSKAKLQILHTLSFSSSSKSAAISALSLIDRAGISLGFSLVLFLDPGGLPLLFFGTGSSSWSSTCRFDAADAPPLLLFGLPGPLRQGGKTRGLASDSWEVNRTFHILGVWIIIFSFWIWEKISLWCKWSWSWHQEIVIYISYLFGRSIFVRQLSSTFWLTQLISRSVTHVVSWKILAIYMLGLWNLACSTFG